MIFSTKPAKKASIPASSTNQTSHKAREKALRPREPKDAPHRLKNAVNLSPHDYNLPDHNALRLSTRLVFSTFWTY
jgi:hypothetical protein